MSDFDGSARKHGVPLYASLGRREGEHKYTGTITVQEAAVASSLLLPMPCVGNVCEGEQTYSGTIPVHRALRRR